MVFLFILLLATLLRLVFLNTIPTSITGDELTYVLTAKSFLLSGHDASGTIAPWQLLLFQYPPISLPQAELPYFLLMPFVAESFSLFMVHLPFAMLGIVLVGLVYLVTKELFDHKVALLAAFFASISPWFIFINRTAYEMTPAMVFYLLGFYILLRTKGWHIFLAFPIFLLAFYSYIGTKLVFLPFIILAILYLYFVKHKRTFGKQYLSFFVVSLAFVLLFVILLASQSGSRTGDILLPNSSQVVEQVNRLRALALPSPLTSLFVNKFTIYGQMLVSNLFGALSTSYLFQSGDAFFGMWRHGLFYYLDAFFVLIGGVTLFRNHKARFGLLLGAILIGLLPEILHKNGDNFTPHITFIFPFVLMIAAYGVISFVHFFKKVQSVLLIGILFLYSISLSNFLSIYFYQNPIQGESDFSVRVLSRYLALADASGQEVIVYSQRSNDLLRKHIFYASLYDKDKMVFLSSQLVAKEPSFINVKFSSCDDKITPEKATETMITAISCGGKLKILPHLTIPQLLDGGGIYRIYNDKVCSQYPLKPYPSGLKLGDFDVEKLSQQKFCQTFITSTR